MTIMARKQKFHKVTKIVDKTIKISEASGNGVVKMSVSVDEKGRLARYSLTYVNFKLCSKDNGRVLGYDNSHGYHHRHYMGKEEPVEFEHYESIAERFEKEWRVLHAKVNKQKG